MEEQLQQEMQIYEHKMQIDEFIDKCLEYNQANNINIKQFKICPVHVFASYSNKSCHEILGGTKNCRLCGEPICPICGNHNVTQLSRVTGYMSDVGGWNSAKKQELIDRKRYYL